MSANRFASLRNHVIQKSEVAIVDAFREFIDAKTLENKRSRTLDDHKKHFRYFMEYCAENRRRVTYLSDVTTQLCRDFVAFMKNHKRKWDDHPHMARISQQTGLSPVTINVRMRSLKAQFNWYVQTNKLASSPWDHIKLLKPDDEGLESFAEIDLIKLFQVPDRQTFVGYRNYAILAVLLDTGIRCGELVSLDESNVDLKRGTIRIDAAKSKTREGRTVPISDRTIRILRELMAENSKLRERDTALFINVDGKRLNDSSIRHMMAECGKKAGLTHVRVSPHTMRHTFAKMYRLNGGDIESLQQIMGHSQESSVTKRYLKMNFEELKLQHRSYNGFESTIPQTRMRRLRDAK